MSEQFKVGEIAVGQNMIFDTDRNGVECEILEGLRVRDGFHPAVGALSRAAYLVRWVDGKKTHVAPRNLRRRKPPTTGEQFVMGLFRNVPQREKEPA